MVGDSHHEAHAVRARPFTRGATTTAAENFRANSRALIARLI